MKVVLELQEQLANVRRVTVRHDIVIGRGSDCNLRLSAPQMSRRHCFLRVGRDGVSVTDLDSSNGTYVDNQRIKPGERVELKTGSILTLGPVNFIVHLKEDSGSTTRSEGDRSRKSTKSASGASESSTIVSSAAAIIAEEFSSKPPLQYSVEQAGASAEPHEATARIRKDHAGDVAAPAVKKAAAAAVSAAVVAPISKSGTKAESVNTSPLADNVAESPGTEESQTTGSESSWLTDDSPDDLSFFGGQQSDDFLASAEGSLGSAATGNADDVVEEVVEVLDDEDIFAEEVVEAVLAEEPVEAVEVLEDELVEVFDEVPLEAVELLHDGTPANALTADFEEADLLGEQFLEVLDEPEVLAEELVEAELIEEIDESAEVVEVLDDDEPVEVMEAVSAEPNSSDAELVEVLEEPSDFFDMLGIDAEEPQQAMEQGVAVETAGPVEELVEEPVDAELVEEPAEAVQVLDEEETAAALEEPSDFFAMLGIDAEEPQQATEQFAAVEAAGPVEELVEEPVDAELVEEPAEAVQVLDEEETAAALEEPSDFFAMLGIDAEEPQQAIEQGVAVEAAGAVEESSEIDWFSDTVEEVVDVAEEQPAGVVVDDVELFDDVDLFEESSISDDKLPDEAAAPDSSVREVVTLEQTAVPASESSWGEVELSGVADAVPGDEFDFLNSDAESVASSAAAEVEPFATAAVDATQGNAVAQEFAETGTDAEFDAEKMTVEEVEAVQEFPASDIEAVEEFDFFDDIETIEPVATVEQTEAVEEFDAEVEEIELFDEAAEADIVAENDTATEPVAESTAAPMEEFAAVEEAEAVEEAWDFAEIAADDVVMTDDESPEVVAAEEEVAEVAEEDEATNWFDIGDDKSEDDDDPELRKFLKGF